MAQVATRGDSFTLSLTGDEHGDLRDTYAGNHPDSETSRILTEAAPASERVNEDGTTDQVYEVTLFNPELRTTLDVLAQCGFDDLAGEIAAVMAAREEAAA